MNPNFLTPRPGKTYTRDEEIRQDWFEGAEFRMYRMEGLISIRDRLRMQMAGFTHAYLIYQNADMQVKSVLVDLKET